MADKDEKYNLEIIQKINALSKSLGFTHDEQTLLEIEKTKDKDRKSTLQKESEGVIKKQIVNKNSDQCLVFSDTLCIKK